MKYVLYHSNCYDGFGSAYAAWKKFGDSAKYIPVSYGAPVPDMPDADEIYILDFSYDANTIVNLTGKCKVTLIDHHKTAQEKLTGLFNHDRLFIKFDMTKSGALLSWEYFHPDVEVPHLIKHISDRDLWKFEMFGSKEVHAALVAHPFDFKVWDNFNTVELIEIGKGCLMFEESVVKKICEKAWIGRVGDHDVPMVNTAAHWSEVGHELLSLYPDAPFVASFTIMKNGTMWSLRSRPEFDCSEVAKKYGGGGHKNAAGFKTPGF